MKTLLAIALLAALGPTQAKPPAEIVKAEKAVADRPDDAESHWTLGRYYGSLGDWERALPHLAKGSDEFFRALAEKDAAGGDAYALGESWWTGSTEVEAHLLTGATSTMKVELKKRATALRAPMRERAVFWFTKAWPGADREHRAKMLEIARNLSAPPAGPSKGAATASGWTLRSGASRDGAYAHDGRFSVSVPCSKEEAPNYARIQGGMIQIPPGTKQVTFSAWVRTEGAEPRSALQVGFWTVGMDGITQGGPEISDCPFWTRLERTITVPERASKMSVFLVAEASKGTIWIDDISLRIGERELIENGGFEK